MIKVRSVVGLGNTTAYFVFGPMRDGGRFVTVSLINDFSSSAPTTVGVRAALLDSGRAPSLAEFDAGEQLTAGAVRVPVESGATGVSAGQQWLGVDVEATSRYLVVEVTVASGPTLDGFVGVE